MSTLHQWSPHLQEPGLRDSSSESCFVEVAVETDGQRESDLRVVELLHVGPSALVGRDLFHSDYLNRVGSGPMSGTHIAICQQKHVSHLPFGQPLRVYSQQEVTALATEMSRYSLYMLCVPVLELYLNQTPKFLTRSAGLSSCTSLMSTISPLAFFTFLSFLVKYQKRDLATMWSGAKIVIR